MEPRPDDVRQQLHYLIDLLSPEAQTVLLDL